jgi:uncharacterized membrane protein
VVHLSARGILLLTFPKPGVLNEIISGEIQGLKIGQEALAFYAFIVLLPLVMVFLPVTLKDTMNRGANMVIGIIGLILSFVGIFEQFTNPYAYAVMIWWRRPWSTPQSSDMRTNGQRRV